MSWNIQGCSHISSLRFWKSPLRHIGLTAKKKWQANNWKCKAKIIKWASIYRNSRYISLQCIATIADLKHWDMTRLRLWLRPWSSIKWQHIILNTLKVDQFSTKGTERRTLKAIVEFTSDRTSPDSTSVVQNRKDKMWGPLWQNLTLTHTTVAQTIKQHIVGRYFILKYLKHVWLFFERRGGHIATKSTSVCTKL